MIDDDAVDHESWIAELLSDILLEKEDNAFLHGDGENKPMGILSYADGTDSNSIERVEGGQNVSFENLLRLQASLDGKYERAGETAFITSKKTLAKIRSIKDDSGHYIWTPGALIGKEDCIFGTPIYSTGAMNEGEDAVIYGNLRKGYQIVDRSDIKIQRDPYSSKPFVVFFATKRVGGDVIDTRAIKVLKLS
jgi:HK97 family phage major capsid protein